MDGAAGIGGGERRAIEEKSKDMALKKRRCILASFLSKHVYVCISKLGKKG